MSKSELDHTLYEDQILKEGGRNFDCDLCDRNWPESHLRWQSGRKVGVMCDWEPNGGETERDVMRAEASELAARLDARAQIPPSFAGTHGGEDEQAVTAISPNPINVVAGVYPSVTITGEGLTAADTFTTDHQTISIAKTVVSATEVTLALSGASPAVGDFDLVFNTDRKFRDVITVRS